MKIADTHQNKLKLVTVYLSQLSEFTIHTPPYQGKTCINRNNHYTYHYHCKMTYLRDCVQLNGRLLLYKYNRRKIISTLRMYLH